MGDFRPSFEAAQAALPGTPMVARPHPVGAKGASVSLNEVAARIVQGMNDGRVRAWAIRTLKLAGEPQGNRARAQALLDALRSKAMYVPDPVNTEFMQAAALTLCLDEHGLCFNGGDCFPKGTLLLREDFVLVPIEAIEVGSRIWGLNGWTRVEAKVEKGELSVDAITLSNDAVVRLTPDHHVFLDFGKSYLPVRARVVELKVGMFLVQPDAKIAAAQILNDVAIQKLVERVNGHVEGNESAKPIVIVKIERFESQAYCYDIQTEDHYVYLPEHDVTVSQCDDLSVALGAALSSVNVPVKVLGQAFKNEPLPSHVLLTVGTEDGWKKVDPSSKTFRVGEGFQATREWTIDPFEEANPNVVDGTMSGMFVGVGQVPGDWIPENSFLYKSWVQKWQQEIYELEKANNNLGAALVNITYTRGVSRPDNPYDPEPGVNGNPGKKIRDVTDFPTDGTWTQSMAIISMDLYDMGGKFVRAGHEAMARKRKILVDPKTNESVLERLPTDPYSTKTFVPYAPGNAPMSNMVLPEKIVAFYDAAGDLVSGMTESGVALTKEEVEARTKNPTGLALGPLVVFWIVVGVAFVSVSTVVIVMKNNNKAETLARLALDSEIVKCIADKKCSENVLSIEGHNAVEFKKAQTANDEANPFTGIAKSIGGIVTWLVIGGVAAGGFVLLSPVIRKAFDEATKKKEPAYAPARLHAVKA